ncbi:MAG TPA: hypothetical protein VFV23_01830 [Verrucomicrobiae bacterium]|nr:hypothetical protein [Verrucomicrobiae bacterium]
MPPRRGLVVGGFAGYKDAAPDGAWKLETVLKFMWFSQRKGYKSVKNIVQLEQMDDDLRNSLWNALCEGLFDLDGFFTPNYNNPNRTELLAPQFTDEWWSKFLKKTKDTKPRDFGKIYGEMRDRFFSAEWNEVYDFVEFTLNFLPHHKLLENKINAALESEFSGYRAVGQRIIEITDQNELQTVDNALNQKEFTAAAKHLHRALELISDKKTPTLGIQLKNQFQQLKALPKKLPICRKPHWKMQSKHLRKKANFTRV